MPWSLLQQARIAGGHFLAWLLIAAVCWGQPGKTPREQEDFMKRGGETPRFFASSVAVTRALNYCNGLWSAGLDRDTIEQELNGKDPIAGVLPPSLETRIDEAHRRVTVLYDRGLPPRIAVWRPILGCTQLPVGAAEDAADRLPAINSSIRAPDLSAKPWPMGDSNPTVQLPPANHSAVQKLVDAAFDQGAYGGHTWGVIVVYRGKIVAERYRQGFSSYRGSQTHSAAKSFVSTLAGIAVGHGLIELEKPGIIKAWNRPQDPRRAITLQHLLRMSSGLYSEGNGSPFQKIYFQGGTVEQLATSNVLDTIPGTRFVYSPPDTMLVMRAIREAMQDDERYLAFPFVELFWKIGMTHTTCNTDWNGDFLMSGQTWSTARDFARFGLLYLNEGMWEGERILPKSWTDYVSVKGPAQPSKPPYYGAQFWLFGGMSGLPADAFSPVGGQGQYAMIIRSRDTVVVRRGIDTSSTFEMDRFTADVLNALP